MKVLMFGWEFPPHFAGGVGTVCYQLSKSLVKAGMDLTFVMPSAPEEVSNDFLKLVVADHHAIDESLLIDTYKIGSFMKAYEGMDEYKEEYNKHMKRILENNKKYKSKLYGENLLEEIWLFAQKVKLIDYGNNSKFDLIHAHDWTTFPAAVEMKKKLGIPLAVHIHITEYDKNSGSQGDPRIHDLEKYGMEEADVVICISNKIKDICVEKYGIDPKKIAVIHNGAEEYPIITMNKPPFEEIKENDKIVLYLGRVATNKGANYFVDAAKLVAEHTENVKFVLAGTGNLLPTCVQKIEEYGLNDKFLVTGFSNRETSIKLFNSADVFVMPSVSEPFGLVPFEAIWANTPTIVSKQSGVSEVLTHCIKADFWDTEKMADSIINILEDKTLNNKLKKHGKMQVEGMTWDIVADKFVELYGKMLGDN